jgi:hypothetical protein
MIDVRRGDAFLRVAKMIGLMDAWAREKSES